MTTSTVSPTAACAGDADEQLVRAEAQRGAHLRFEFGNRLLRVPGELEVERALHPDGAVHELGDEPAVAWLEVAAAEQLRDQDVRERAVLDPHERVERAAARRRPSRALDAVDHDGRPR